ncbi:MAG: sigma-70 family RNA polymerase sigma factor [Clostridiales Family XIII bacterium]|nr:sigma-70 family RNA polymerase sigma factor [Clostridiales Family XIII bacterium]
MAEQKIVELARRSVKGDKKAFEDLIRAKQRGLLFAAYTILKDRADAEDAVQEAIISMYRHIGKLRSPEAVSAWAEKIVRNESYRIYQARTGRQDEADIDDEGIDVAEDARDLLPEKYAEDSAFRDQLYKSVLTLPTAKREAIIMYYYEDLSYKEIAKVTGTSINTVATNLNKARTALKRKLEDSDIKVNGMAGLASTSAVISKSLKAESFTVVPDEQIAGFEAKWVKALNSAAKPAHVSSAAKAALVVVITTVAFVGIVGAVILTGSGASANDADAQAAVIGRSIAFSDGDCECGHINPGAVTIENLDAGDKTQAWEIISAGGSAIFSGNESDLNAKIGEMAEAHQDGEYTLRCNLSDKNGYEITVERAFEIGDNPDGAAT